MISPDLQTFLNSDLLNIIFDSAKSKHSSQCFRIWGSIREEVAMGVVLRCFGLTSVSDWKLISLQEAPQLVGLPP